MSDAISGVRNHPPEPSLVHSDPNTSLRPGQRALRAQLFAADTGRLSTQVSSWMGRPETEDRFYSLGPPVERLE